MKLLKEASVTTVLKKSDRNTRNNGRLVSVSIMWLCFLNREFLANFVLFIKTLTGLSEILGHLIFSIGTA